MISSKKIDINADVSNLEPNLTQTCIKSIINFRGDYTDFFHNYLVCNLPVVISDVSSHWRCSKLWVKNGLPNIDYLRTSYGNATVSVADCNEQYFNAQRKRNMKFRYFTDYWMKIMQNDHPYSEPCLYLKDWHFTRDFPNEDLYITPPQFCSDWLNEYFTSNHNLNDDYRFVYMGPTGSWTPFHVDVFTSFSWSVNICGEKRWILLEPGEENKLKDKLGNLPYDISFLDDVNNNINVDNNFSDIKYHIITQKAGEALFVPSGWYHQVRNMRDTISINHNWINGCNIENMWISLKKNFEDVKSEIAEFQDSMVDWHNHCQLMLKACFGMDFKDFYNFITFILRRRKECIKTEKELNVYGNWLLGSRHIRFDLIKLENICEIFEKDTDVQLLFNEHILTKISIN